MIRQSLDIGDSDARLIKNNWSFVWTSLQKYYEYDVMLRSAPVSRVS